MAFDLFRPAQPTINPHANLQFGYIAHISVRMRTIVISTLDDGMAFSGHMSDDQFAELLDYWRRDPVKMVTYQPEGPDGMQARHVQIFNYTWGND